MLIPRELAREVHVVINAKIQACIKLIGNHAKKSCLGKETAKNPVF